MYFGNLTKIATKMINSNDTALCYRQSLEGPILTFPGIQKHACFSYKLSVFPKKRGSPSSPTPTFAKQVLFSVQIFYNYFGWNNKTHQLNPTRHGINKGCLLDQSIYQSQTHSINSFSQSVKHWVCQLVSKAC